MSQKLLRILITEIFNNNYLENIEVSCNLFNFFVIYSMY